MNRVPIELALPLPFLSLLRREHELDVPKVRSYVDCTEEHGVSGVDHSSSKDHELGVPILLLFQCLLLLFQCLLLLFLDRPLTRREVQLRPE